MKKKIQLLLGLSLIAGVSSAYALSGIGSIASNVTGNLTGVAKLITAASYVAGMGFSVGGIVKLKAHKDNPTQVPISAGIALIFVGAALLFVPAVFKTSGTTLFGSGATAGSVSGVAKF